MIQEKENNTNISLKRFEGIINNIDGMCFIKDTGSQYMSANDRLAHAARCGSLKSIIGKYDTDMPWSEFTPDYIDGDRCAIALSGSFRLEQIVLNNTYFSITSSKFPLYDENHNIVAVGGIVNTLSDNGFITAIPDNEIS